MSQLPFDFPVSENYRTEDFLVTDCNRHAWLALATWPNWQESTMLLAGPSASGKTHLARIWAQRSHARLLRGAELASPADSPALFGAYDALAVEDIAEAPEEALFHLLNHMRGARNRWLLLTMRDGAPPALPDLRSRLNALPTARLREPDDGMLAALLVKHFADRQVPLKQEMLLYLLPRIERSYAGVRQLAEKLDKLSLSLKKPVTMQMVRNLLTEN